MFVDLHLKAALQHEMAAKAHRAAAQRSHTTDPSRAREYAIAARGHSKAAHEASELTRATILVPRSGANRIAASK